MVVCYGTQCTTLLGILRETDQRGHQNDRHNRGRDIEVVDKETIIKDGKILVRHINEIEVGNEEELLQMCLREDTFQILPYANPPIVPWTDEHFTMLTPKRDRVLFVHKINKFPLCGAGLIKHPNTNFWTLMFQEHLIAPTWYLEPLLLGPWLLQYLCEQRS